MKKKILKPMLVICMLIAIASIFVACDSINTFLHGGSTGGKAPKITAVYTEKARDDWYQSREYLFNKDCTNPMALDDGEKYYVVLEYDNAEKLSVSSVKINGVKYDSTAFVEGSNYAKTKILFQVEDRAETQNITYLINNVMYVSGSSTTRMQWEANVPNEVTVAIRPFFQLTLDDMNIDFRAESSRSSSNDSSVRVASSSAYYNTKMQNFNIYKPNFDDANSSVITKRGGWVFAGWFTKPKGEGIQITDDDTYFFWCDITLYAYFERMYEIETVKLDSTLEYNYADDKLIRFTTGAVIKNRDFKSNEATHCPILEIPNTVIVENIVYSETVGDYGVPVYNVSVAHSEYPVVKIDNLAFKGFNTITDASIGKFVKEIGYGAFWNCTKMGTFEFGQDSQLKYIGDYAFYNAKVLGSESPFTLPDELEYIGSLAFRDSGWKYSKEPGSTRSSSTFYVKNTWKYLGYRAFMGTNFTGVVFEPGCYFEGQIDAETGAEIESKEGNKTVQEGNLIGAYLFAGCLRLSRVEFRADEKQSNALNIIPDRCFDMFSYTKEEGDSEKLSNVFFSEGLVYIGQKAFFYQTKLTELDLPASLEEVDVDAFYECEKVETLKFADNSQLRILHNSAFGNLVSIDSVTINSTVFEKYGSGVFRGCDRLKCVIFDQAESVPVGYKAGERKSKDGKKDLEVVVGHKQADFLYATAEAGEKEKTNEDDDDNKDAKTYSSPIRIFCPSELLEGFEEEMKRGKEMEAAGHSSGTSVFASSVFVHSLDNLIDYTYENDEGDIVKVKVAVQEVYRAYGNEKRVTSEVLGYSLVYWGDRSKYIKLPTADELNLNKGKIIELAYYAVPTSVNKVVIPSSYTRLDHDAFNGCSQLTEVEFENIDTLEYIGDYAFFGTGIKYFIGGENLKVIGQYAFQRCLTLKWVDLRNCPITNRLKGRNKYRDMCKYEYEVFDEQTDYNDMLGYGAFQGCKMLNWIYLPKVEQLTTATFKNCESLGTVIIPTEASGVSLDHKSTNDEAFYQYGQPNTVYNYATMHKLRLIVNVNAIGNHREVYPRDDYQTISESNTQQPQK